METVNIIGAGIAGLNAARTLAKGGTASRLISSMCSQRAQSNLAEGGINAALDVMGEGDSVEEHFRDTMSAGVYLSDEKMVRALTESAPEIVKDLQGIGVPFNSKDGHIVQRNFGGQIKKRTAYAKSSTGRVITAALINEVRKHEVSGMVRRLPHHSFRGLCMTEDECTGVLCADEYSGQVTAYTGPVIICCGGLNGFFPSKTTGTVLNSGTVQAILFSQGVEFSNLEFMQYHPTTVEITGKRLLISEAARGEGGRLYYEKDGKPYYFLEEKFGERGNLMPRDVISREMALINEQVYLDMTPLSKEVWDERLSDLREEIMDYLDIDPALDPVSVSPGIHFFMGGIRVDENHRTNIRNLYAAGECACAYHGANRLGGNSLLGAMFGGKTAADSVAKDRCEITETLYDKIPSRLKPGEEAAIERLGEILMSGLGILRDEKGISGAIAEAAKLSGREESDEFKARLMLSKAMLTSALLREESRGAHTRTDHQKMYGEPMISVSACGDDDVSVEFIKVNV